MRRVTANEGTVQVGGQGGGRGAERRARTALAALGLAWTLGVLGVVPDAARAQETTGGVLAECATLSPLLDDIHACLDDYLAVMDERLDEIDELVDRTLDGEARRAFALSRSAFATFRRDNCLWYLAFSTPRAEAEQIGKDCLARMSLERLAELQALLVERGADAPKSGYYVYGAERNTFRPCGSEARYWVEGDAAAVGELQQTYLEVATEDLQVLFARLEGALDDAASAPSGHSGTFRAGALVELRVPREGDCRLPGGTPSLAAEPVAEASPAPSASVPETDPEPPEPAAPEAPEQQLIAYFGAWLADCTESAGSRACALSTALEADGAVAVADDGAAEDGAADDAVRATLSVLRPADGGTGVELFFPDREIDSPAKLRWGVDADVLGDVVGSAIRVDARGTRQVLEPGPYVEDELLPRMIAGNVLVVDVLDSVDDDGGERHRSTLVGLTRALAFADGFVRDGGGL